MDSFRFSSGPTALPSETAAAARGWFNGAEAGMVGLTQYAESLIL